MQLMQFAFAVRASVGQSHKSDDAPVVTVVGAF